MLQLLLSSHLNLDKEPVWEYKYILGIARFD